MQNDIVKTIEYKDKQLLVTLDFWGTKVLFKIVLSDQDIAAIIRENGVNGIKRKDVRSDTQYKDASSDSRLQL